MFYTLSLNELKKIEKNLSFYDFKNLDAKNQLLIKLSDEIDITRYDDVQFGGSIENFIYLSNVLKLIIMDLIQYLFQEPVILSKYQNNWIIDRNKNIELYKFLKLEKIRNNYSGALCINDNIILKEFIDANFKFNSFVQFIFPNSKIIITPTDHLDIFIASSNIDETYNIICRIISSNSIENIISISKV